MGLDEGAVGFTSDCWVARGGIVAAGRATAIERDAWYRCHASSSKYGLTAANNSADSPEQDIAISLCWKLLRISNSLDTPDTDMFKLLGLSKPFFIKTSSIFGPYWRWSAINSMSAVQDEIRGRQSFSICAKASFSCWLLGTVSGKYLANSNARSDFNVMLLWPKLSLHLFLSRKI